MRYFDASALVKRYVREKGSSAVRRLLSSVVPVTSRLSEVEVASALIRRAREGAFTIEERDRALTAFASDLEAMLLVEITEDVTAAATGLLQRHRLCAGDAIQLASCMFLQEQVDEPVPFVAFDRRLTDAARLEGLTPLPAARR
ncbi:MAG: type II toxin-antitoxin system VapC family toxin [Vicinamibacterales bacterium]|jgi:predicted nucleic acid-binding protein|nr:type II toxin-antitoxin system VapC family toxin [Vicinamibacterales bacterium]HJN43978.1 type II toxin-antitoxin system VapC family toxin [Vicinamibacterales bacterium]|tara:strand:- start:80 stop:511 length:432 start_codon:yes stop_codon:yes gene_type:complete